MRLESGAAPPSQLRGPALTPEELEPLDPAAGVMPEVVSQRMLGRIIPFASIGVFGSFLTFAGFWYANTKLELDLPPQIVAYVTQALLLLSFAGVTYGVMSTSWDEEREGSLLGTENLRRNFELMRGNEAERIATAQMEQELEDAEKAGIMTSRAALKRRDQREGGMRGDDL